VTREHPNRAERTTTSSGARQALRAREVTPTLAGRVSGLPLSSASMLALQRAAGNGAVTSIVTTVQRARNGENGRRDLPKIDHLSPVAKKLLEGVLEKETVDDAVRQIYDNMFSKTGWRYSATARNTPGRAYIDGSADVGMCENYRNGFAEILRIYDGLRASHPEDAVKEGTLEVLLGNDLNGQRFATRRGLTLMGTTALKGNVYVEVDGVGGVLRRGLDKINTFVFSGHWTLNVNGKDYDPIFHSVDEANVGKRLDERYADGAERFLADISKTTPAGEFGATYVHVVDFPTLLGTVTEIEALHHALPDGSKKSRKAADIFKRKVLDRATFAEVVDVAYNADQITRAQKKAFDAINTLVR
jgi:hypothetical protein